MNAVQKIVAKEPLGTRNGEGYVIDIDELRLLLEMPDAGQQAVEDALRNAWRTPAPPMSFCGSSRMTAPVDCDDD